MSTFDFLVVGAGSAGCVLANRLSADGSRVLLVEAGRDTPPGATPADIEDVFPRSYSNPEYMWPGLQAELGAVGASSGPQPFPQARIMGGGSSVMGMVSNRGLPDDYDQWETGGATGWGWSSVLPYFLRLESDGDRSGPFHGSDGPISIRRHDRSDWPPFSRAVAAAAERRGYPFVADMNASFVDGVYSIPLSSTPTRRVSAAAAYLDETVRRRQNLSIRCETTVERLLFEGTRCVGAATIAGRERCEVRARQVVLSAGAIHSPAILMRSGVGPATELTRLGIPIVAAVEGVGANLQNHPVLYLATHLEKHARQSPALRPQFLSCLRFSSGADEALRADMIMLIMNKSSWHGLGQAVAGLGVGLYRPFSRGSVRLASTDPHTPPVIDFRMLTDPRDHARMVTGLRLALDLMQDEAVRPLRHELFAAGYSKTVRRLNRPGITNIVVTKLLAAMMDGPDSIRRFMIRRISPADPSERAMSEAPWLEQTVTRHTFGMYHPAGTCRMGRPEDATTVVDPACTVQGTEALSVVDASIMPTLIRGNTNIPVIMLAERAADLLRTAPL